MSNLVPDRIAITFNMSADDYVRYHAVLGRHQSGPSKLFGYIVILFGAISVALAFRYFGMHLSIDPAAAELIGRFSLVAFVLGALAMSAAAQIMRRIMVRKHVAGILNAFEAKTAVFDMSGVALTGQLSQTRWQWAAVSGLTQENGLMLIWIGAAPAVAIPHRNFGSDDACKEADAFIRARLSAKAV